MGKKTPDKKAVRGKLFTMWMTEQEMALVRRAARKAGIPVSDKVRPYMLKWAKRVLG